MSGISNLTTTDSPLWESPENHGPLVSVVTWFLVITAFLSVLARLGTRYAVVRSFQWDDASIVFAMALSIGHSATTSLSVSNGLGQHVGSVSTHNLELFQKSIYAGGFLFVGVLAAVKISMCLYLHTLTPVRLHRSFLLALGSFICLWMLACFFVMGFQCHLPRTWLFVGGKCIDMAGFWIFVYVINILTDLALIVLPWIVLSQLQAETKRKVIIISCFAARIFTVAATVVQIYYSQSGFTSAKARNDPTFDFWKLILMGEVVITLSLVTACIPYLKPFLEALGTGMIRADGGAVSRGRGFGYGHNQHGAKKYGTSSRISIKPSRSQLGVMRMENLPYAGEKNPDVGRQTATVSTKGHGNDSDNDSQTSQSKIIRKTVGWSVTEEPTAITPPENIHSNYPSRTDYARAV